jgi:hypothetical protein
MKKYDLAFGCTTGCSNWLIAGLSNQEVARFLSSSSSSQAPMSAIVQPSLHLRWKMIGSFQAG